VADFPIDTSRFPLFATGKVTAVTEWIDGKPSKNQQRDADTGMPLWMVDVLIDDDAARSTVAGVQVGSPTEPQVQKFRPVEFAGLAVSVYVNRKTNTMSMRFKADHIATGQKAAAA